MKKLYCGKTITLKEADWITSELAKLKRKTCLPLHDNMRIYDEILPRYGLEKEFNAHETLFDELLSRHGVDIGSHKSTLDMYLSEIKKEYNFQLCVCNWPEQPKSNIMEDFSLGECFKFFTIFDKLNKVIELWFITR